MESCCKKSRVEQKSDHFQDISFDLDERWMREIAYELNTLCLVPNSAAVTVRPLKILNCNAADDNSGSGIPFSEAYCSIEKTSTVFLFGDIFKKGMKMVVEFIKERKLPDLKHEKIMLSKLLRCIGSDEEDMYTFQDVDRLTETELTTLLANHLFGRLSTSSDYVINKSFVGNRNESKCVCSKEGCKLTGSYGDTSIGNGKVWHGNMDIIVNNEVGVGPLDDKEDSYGGKSPVKAKIKSTNLSTNWQILAETIVFSFLQKKRHPDQDNFLSPCIGVGSSEMVIMFYDAEFDILMESGRVPLMQSMDNGVSKFSLGAILVSWLVVNYRYLCNGLTEDMKSYMKSDFFNQAKKKIDIYKSDLKFQNVGLSTPSAEKVTEDHDAYMSSSNLAYELHKDILEYLKNN